jgi:serralysin
VFTALTSTGYLPSSAFYAGSAAHDASDRIIYNSATGAVSYDSDGNGAAAPVQFAQVSTGLNLTSSDFHVI